MSSNKHGQILPQSSFLENREEIGRNYYIKKSIDLISPNCGGPFIGELVQLSELQFLQWQNKGSKLYFSLRFVSATVLYKCKSMQNLVNCFVPYSPDF